MREDEESEPIEDGSLTLLSESFIYTLTTLEGC